MRIEEEQRKEKEKEEEKRRIIEEKRRIAEEEERKRREEEQRKREEERKRREEEQRKREEEKNKRLLEQENKLSNTLKNYSQNQKLLKLNEQNINDIFGEKSKELSKYKKIHILDRKINNCDIKEKLNLNITLKNPNKEYLYETEIYNDEDKLISKTEQKSDKNELILVDNSELIHKFTKTQTLTIVLIKHINSGEKIRTVMKIPLYKIISNNNQNYQENIDNFDDNELINIGLDTPNEKEKLIELNFNTEENGNNNHDICYSIQKGENILFKSAVCKSSNIKKSDKIKLSDLEPEFEISFYNEELEEKKIIIQTADLKNGLLEDLNFSNIDNLKIKIFSEETESNSFIKLLKAGLNLDLSIAIDFTGSNGNPKCKNSLHFISNGFINNYEKAMRENIKIISMYNKSNKYNVYGFGAQLNGKFKDIFNINGNDDESIIGIENIISKYKETVNSVYFAGPTLFAPVIKEIKRKVEINYDNNFNYNILLIISDGYIDDITETIDTIIEASKFPISFIIIGVGDDVNYDMKRLNGESGKLISSTGEILNKDIVQYVHYNDYADDLNKLTEAVLKYIPDQISNYYKDKL